MGESGQTGQREVLPEAKGWLWKLAALVLAALVLAGCGGTAHKKASHRPSGHQHENATSPSTTTSTTTAVTSTTAVTRAPSTTTTPALGAQLAEEAAQNNQPLYVLPSPSGGFDIFNDQQGDGGAAGGVSVDASTIDTYSADGQHLAEIPAQSFTGVCGAQDVAVPGVGRALVTFAEGSTPAKGVVSGTQSMTLQEWSATTGAQNWKMTFAKLPTQWCEANGSGVTAAGTSSIFAATLNGAWGAAITATGTFEGIFSGGYVVNLATGVGRYDPALIGVLGNYMLDVSASGAVRLTDPSSGSKVGSVPNTIATFQSGSNAVRLPTWMYNGSDGLLSDGDLVASKTESSPASMPSFSVYQLPSMKVVWSSPIGETAVVGDDGGVLVVNHNDCDAAGNGCLIGFNDRTGAKLWRLPQGTPCGFTSTQMLLAVNGQQALIDLQTGKQISYTAVHGCPTMLPGGLQVKSSETQTSVIQKLAP